MSSITIEKPQNINLSNSELKALLENIIGDLDAFDVHLLNTYYRKKDIPLHDMLNI